MYVVLNISSGFKNGIWLEIRGSAVRHQKSWLKRLRFFIKIILSWQFSRCVIDPVIFATVVIFTTYFFGVRPASSYVVKRCSNPYV